MKIIVADQNTHALQSARINGDKLRQTLVMIEVENHQTPISPEIFLISLLKKQTMLTLGSNHCRTLIGQWCQVSPRRGWEGAPFRSLQLWIISDGSSVFCVPCPALTASMLLLLLGIVFLHVAALVLLFVSTITSVSMGLRNNEWWGSYSLC